MLAYVGDPAAFAERETPAELSAKREKQAQRTQKKAEEVKAPRAVNKAAQAKKAAAQREGLDLLEKLLLDLVSAGGWFEAARLERLERQARQLNDAYLPGAALGLRRLAAAARLDGPDERRQEAGADQLARLWALVQKGRAYLDGKVEGEAASEADAVLEELLGHAWQLAELRDRGHVRTNLNLLELAYERVEDQARQERVETSYLLDLNEGTIYRAVTYRPFKGLDRIPGQPSYAQPLRLSEAAVYPGFLNRRVRWDKGAEQTEPLRPVHLQAAYALASPVFDGPLAAYRQQRKNPLAADEAVFLLRCQKVGRVGERVVLQDAKGARLEAESPAGSPGNAANLLRAAGMVREPAVLVRFGAAAPARVVVRPLAVLTETVHLRLGV
jgi:hypothetical protein